MIEIVVDPDTLECSPAGSITGKICLRGPTDSFPGEYWRDFPVVLLTWWVTGLGLVASGDRRTFSGDFMDGPYSFLVEVDSGEVGRIVCPGSESNIGFVSIDALLQSAVAAGRLILESCRGRAWVSRDLESLEEALVGRPNNSFKPKPLRGST